MCWDSEKYLSYDVDCRMFTWKFQKTIGNYLELVLVIDRKCIWNAWLGNMIFDIVALINSGVITTADLVEFSDELKERVDFILHR